jgi:hypothetical protein
MSRKLRLLKVIVQPVFVLDDGDNLTEVSADPVVVSPEEWPTYPTSGFAQAVGALQAQIDDGSLPPS